MRTRTPIQELRLSYRIAQRIRRLMWHDIFKNGWYRDTKKREETIALRSTIMLSNTHVVSMSQEVTRYESMARQKIDALENLKLTHKDFVKQRELLQPELDRLLEIQEILNLAIRFETMVRDCGGLEMKWTIEQNGMKCTRGNFFERILHSANIGFGYGAGGSGDNGFCTESAAWITVDFSDGQSHVGQHIRQERAKK